jgi:hypothetical protein
MRECRFGCSTRDGSTVVCLFCRMSSHLRAVQTRSDLRAIRGPSLRRVTGEYDEIEYAGLPVNSSIFVISLCRSDFQRPWSKALGQNNAEIAAQLAISVGTVKAHVSSVLANLAPKKQRACDAGSGQWRRRSRADASTSSGGLDGCQLLRPSGTPPSGLDRIGHESMVAVSAEKSTLQAPQARRRRSCSSGHRPCGEGSRSSPGRGPPWSRCGSGRCACPAGSRARTATPTRPRRDPVMQSTVRLRIHAVDAGA